MVRPGFAAKTLLVGLATVCLARPLAAQSEPDAWSLLAEHFEFAECSIGEQADRWARHYAAHPLYLMQALSRAEPWIAYIANEIQRRGLPGELALLPIAESGFDPFAFSRRGAAGNWQLLAETGRLHGLEINQWYDGRRDTYAATQAALDYLESLHARFDRRWELAIAAYNAGPSRVARSLRTAGIAGGHLSWTQLSLPGETRVYVSRILGLSCLFAHPQRYGFVLPEIRPERQFTVIEIDGPIDVIAFAARAGLQADILLELNAGLRGLFTSPGGPHYLLVPVSSKEQARVAAATIPASAIVDWSRENEKRGDTLTGIARRHDASVTAVKQLNGLEETLPEIGQQVLVPSAHSRPDDPQYRRRLIEFVRLQARSLPERRHHHRVRAGEDLWALSQRYSVPIDTIRKANGLGRNGRIRSGQLIEIPPGGDALKPNQYRVEQGDTLWSIAREYGISVRDLRAHNTIAPTDLLKPGDVLYVGEDKCCGNIDRFVSP